MSTQTRAIKILGHRAGDRGWSAHAPQVGGVFGHGESLEAAVSDWRRAAALYREKLRGVGVHRGGHTH
ncbi:MAG: hypothetical protein WAL63_01595 [Solirubrobacteraceae bacterium]